MFQGKTKESMEEWLRQARYAVGRAYGHDHPAYARQLLDLATLITFSAVLAHRDLRPSERQLRAAGRTARQALRVSQVVPGARRYVFMSLICVSTYFIYLRDYRKAEDRLAEASRVLDEIADKDSARVAEVRRPLLLRAQAVVFAGLADYARATHRINELREQRSRELLTNRCERARDKCVEAQVLFSAGRLSAVDARQDAGRGRR